MSLDGSRKRLKVTLKKSVIGRLRSHEACVRGLGLKRINQTVVVEDTRSTRGMVKRVSYMVECEEL